MGFNCIQVNDPTKYEIIIQANPEVSITPILASGVKLKIPVIEEKETISFTTVVGLNNDVFENFDDEKMVKRLNECFAPEIRYERRTVSYEEVNIGVIYVYSLLKTITEMVLV